MILIVVGGCKARYVYAPAFVVLANALGKDFSAPSDLEDVIGVLVLTLLFISQVTPEEQVSISVNNNTWQTHCLSSMSMAIRMKLLGVVPWGWFTPAFVSSLASTRFSWLRVTSALSVRVSRSKKQ